MMYTKAIPCIILLILGCVSILSSQNESYEVDVDPQFAVTFTSAEDRAPSVSEPLPSGEYYATFNSHVSGSPNGTDHMIVIRYDANNAVQWKMQYGASGSPGSYIYTSIRPYDITTTGDGGCVITGTYINNQSPIANDWDMFVTKISAAGLQQWFLTYSGNLGTGQNAWDEGRAVIETIDPATGNPDGYMITGGVDGMADPHECNPAEYVPNHNTVKLAIVRLDLNGNILWDHKFLSRRECFNEEEPLHQWIRGVDIIQIDANDDGQLENEYMLLAEYEDEVPKRIGGVPLECNPCHIYRNPMLMQFTDAGTNALFLNIPQYYFTAPPYARNHIYPKSLHEIPAGQISGSERYVVSGYTHISWLASTPPFFQTRMNVLLFKVDGNLLPGTSIVHDRNDIDQLAQSALAGTAIHYAGHTLESGSQKAVTGVADLGSLLPLSNYVFSEESDAEFTSTAHGAGTGKYVGVVANATDDILGLSRELDCQCLEEAPFTHAEHPLDYDHVDLDTVRGLGELVVKQTIDPALVQQQKCYTCPDETPHLLRFQTNYDVYVENGLGISLDYGPSLYTGYVAVGYTLDKPLYPSLADHDGVYIKTDIYGGMVSQGLVHEDGLNLDEAFSDVIVCPDTKDKFAVGTIVFGEDGQSLRDTSGYVVKLDQNDAPQWSRNFGINSVSCTTSCTTHHDVFLRTLFSINDQVSTTCDPSPHLIFAGYSREMPDNNDGYIVKADINGTIGAAGTWGYRYGNSGHQMIYDIIQTDDDLDGIADDGYLAVGHSADHWNGTTQNTTAIWLLKLDPSGAVEWSKVYYTPDYITGIAVTATDDDLDGNNEGFMVIGNAADAFNNNTIAVLRTDLSGNLLWNKNISRNNSTIAKAKDVVATGHGTYAVVGETYTTTHHEQGYVLLLSNCGEILRSWDYPYVDPADPNADQDEEDHLEKVIVTRDGGLAAVGSTCSYSGTGWVGDVWIVKMDCEAKSCQENVSDEGVSSFNMTVKDVTARVLKESYEDHASGEPVIVPLLEDHEICLDEEGTLFPEFPKQETPETEPDPARPGEIDLTSE